MNKLLQAILQQRIKLVQLYARLPPYNPSKNLGYIVKRKVN